RCEGRPACPAGVRPSRCARPRRRTARPWATDRPRGRPRSPAPKRRGGAARSRRARGPAQRTSSDPTRLLCAKVLEDSGEGPRQARADRLATQPAQPEREGNGATHLGFELHRVECRRQAGEPYAGVAPEGEPRLIAADEDRFQPRPRAERAETGDEEQPLRWLRAGREPL